MTAQRWFLTTPAQYAAAPVGTQVIDDDGPMEKAGDWWFDITDPEVTEVSPVSHASRCEVKRWGTDADHERACRQMQVRNGQVRLRRQLREAFAGLRIAGHPLQGYARGGVIPGRYPR